MKSLMKRSLESEYAANTAQRFYSHLDISTDTFEFIHRPTISSFCLCFPPGCS